MPTLAATANHLGYPSMSVGGVADHVHVVCGLNRTLSVATLVAKLKVSSNQVLKGKFLLCLGLVDIGRHSSGPTGLAVLGVKPAQAEARLRKAYVAAR